ncbi:MAG TPA: hypothetical protein VKU19_08625 [Bryobacteraceae bacterium]|nr:hypothetical protein [Bryobacteraceae bacterium]
MRYFVLALLSVAASYAQNTPPNLPNLQTDNPPLRLHQFPWEKSAQPPFAQWKLFPLGTPAPGPTANLRLLPESGAGVPKPGAGRVFVTPRKPATKFFAAAPPQPCAIPLTNLLRPAGPIPEIRRVPRTNAALPMKEAHLPAPSCDDRK